MERRSRAQDSTYSEFTDKTVVITGAAGIVGGWTADAFAREGARLFLTDYSCDDIARQRDEGRWSAASDLVVAGCDLSNKEAIGELISAIVSSVSAPDILINNAGIYPHGSLLDTDETGWESILGVNLTAPFLLSVGLARRMIKEERSGVIINVASGAAIITQPGGVPYSVSKAGLVMLSRGLALELAQHNIRVNALNPGLASGSHVSPLDEAHVRNMLGRIPLGREAGPSDAAEAILYLCSSKASFITGAFLQVDGGRTAGYYAS